MDENRKLLLLKLNKKNYVPKRTTKKKQHKNLKNNNKNIKCRNQKMKIKKIQQNKMKN